MVMAGQPDGAANDLGDGAELSERGSMRAFEVVLAWVESRILAGELHVGDQLPPSASSLACST